MSVRDPDTAVLDLFRAPDVPRWRLDGTTCEECGKGALRVVVLGDECSCKAKGRADRACTCLAEGFAACESCGALAQVWPADVVRA